MTPTRQGWRHPRQHHRLTEGGGGGEGEGGGGLGLGGEGEGGAGLHGKSAELLGWRAAGDTAMHSAGASGAGTSGAGTSGAPSLPRMLPCSKQLDVAQHNRAPRSATQCSMHTWVAAA